MFEKIKTSLKFYNGLSKKSFGLSLGNSKWIAGNWVDKEQLKSYSYSAYVYACVKKRADKTSQLLNFVIKKGDKVQDNHPLLKFLAKPNPYQTKNEFFELYQTYKDLTGSVFVHVIKIGDKPKEMYVLRPDTITVQMDKEGTEIIAFKEDVGNGKTRQYEPEEILWSVYPNPLQKDIIDGMSPLRPGAKSVDVDTQLSDYQYNVLKNGGKLEGILSFDSEYLTDNQINEIQEKFAERYSEAKASGKPLVMYGKGDYKNLGLTPTEMSYLESKKATREDILTIYQVPKTILGITDGVQKGNYEEANAVFIKDTVKPLIENIVNKLNEFLVPGDLELSFVDPVPEDVELKLKKADSGTKNFFMTINEKRELMELEPITDGDEILIPFNLVPLGTEMGQPVDTNNDSGEKKKACC